jgi:hypothetical protein
MNRSVEEEMVLERARIGIEARAFLNSSLGKYLMDRAELEEDMLMGRLRKCRPDDLRTNTDIRNDLNVIEYFRSWIGEAINSGMIAEQEAHLMDEAAAED